MPWCDNVLDVYDNIADHFSNTRHYKWPLITEFINSLKKDSLVYDIACGNGRNMNYDNYRFKGVDNCQKFVDICKEKNYDCVLGDMCDLPFPDNSCDALICIASFHHLGNKERRLQAIKEFTRVLKPDGKILITVFSINQPKKTKKKFNNYGDTFVSWNKFGVIYNRFYYIFKIDELKELFNECNLKILEHKWDCGNEIFSLNIL